MAYLRFHRSVRLLPGLRLNLVKTGPSLSLGPRGARLNVGRAGWRTTFSLLGTDLSLINRKRWK